MATKRYEKNPKGLYPCPYCEFESGTPQGIGKHVQMAHGGHAKAAKSNGSGVAQAAAGCAEQQTTGPTPARLGGYLPLTGESLAIRNVCNVAVTFLTDPGWRKLTAGRKRDVLAVMRMRLVEEMALPEAMLTGDMMAGSLDPLATTPAPA